MPFADKYLDKNPSDHYRILVHPGLTGMGGPGHAPGTGSGTPDGKVSPVGRSVQTDDTDKHNMAYQHDEAGGTVITGKQGQADSTGRPGQADTAGEPGQADKTGEHGLGTESAGARVRASPSGGPPGPVLLPPPPADLAQVIVIPCFREPDLRSTLSSLLRCREPRGSVEVLIVINSAASAPSDVIETNAKTWRRASEWSKKNSRSWLLFYPLLVTDLPDRFAGAGLARKVGMDLALQRFNRLDRPGGIISSLDADTLVEANYMQVLQDVFADDPGCMGCNVYFEHPCGETDYPERVCEAIVQYELYQRYYVEALRISGFPWAFHTVGSVFTVRALTYCRQGGMNRRLAGEDFYFLQKVIPLGGFRELNSTAVYPSPRPSDRVPFGTGSFVSKYISQGQNERHTYHFNAFLELRAFFLQADRLFQAGTGEVRGLHDTLPEGIRDFLSGELVEKSAEINGNTSEPRTFRKRFFQWFNAFKVLKYLNFVHESYFGKVPVTCAARDLLDHVLKDQGDKDVAGGPPGDRRSANEKALPGDSHSYTAAGTPANTNVNAAAGSPGERLSYAGRVREMILEQTRSGIPACPREMLALFRFVQKNNPYTC